MESADLGQHTSRRFNEDMERVTTRVMQMGGFVEQQLQRAVNALVEGNSALGEEVAERVRLGLALGRRQCRVDGRLEGVTRVSHQTPPVPGAPYVVSPAPPTPVAGIVPARHAAGIHPVEALRAE